MSMLMACDFTLPQCPVGTECLLNDVNGTAGKCVPGACSVLQQDCTMANTKCIVAPQTDGGFARVCSPFTAGDGGVAEGANCTPQVPDPCQRGAQCLGIQGQPAPTCRRYCNPIVGCGAGAECNFGISFASAAGPSNELHLVCSAVTPCDPITQMPCSANEGCQVYRQGAPPGCLPAGQVAAGGTCTSSAFCVRGLQCVGQGGSGICRAFCNLDAGMPSCAAGMCQNLMGVGIGVCSM
jgi:hypothetical protein